ncbi:MAG: NAD(P)H-hydrate epimerase [Candidatus Omnitrophica bacterium]|nr:NAD(P)H-hydrate epimerase [Candidatus Omnitrophota bacterium]
MTASQCCLCLNVMSLKARRYHRIRRYGLQIKKRQRIFISASLIYPGGDIYFMKKSVTSREMSEIDRKAREEYGITQSFLMENAGRSVAEEVLADNYPTGSRKIALLCGKGNNGGDGFVAARYLTEKIPGELTVYITDRSSVKEGAALDNLKKILDMGISVKPFDKFIVADNSPTIVVDSIFGTGFKGDLRPEIRKVSEMVNNGPVKVYAVDVPSGLDATTGKAASGCFRADKTVTFGLAKKGFFLQDGPEVCGQVVVKDIGFPQSLLREYIS